MSQQILVDFQPKINFACHQNDIAILRELLITNTTQIPWKNVKVQLSSIPAFIKPKIWFIEQLDSNEQREIKDRHIELDAQFLLNLTEAMNGEINIRLEVDGEFVADIKQSVQLLAFNEWGGANYIPELLGAFVTPNAKGIDAILGEVGTLLQQKGKNGAINGYKDKSASRVWEMVSALYAVIAKQGITYCLPPQSFEKNGQKIRIPNSILEDKVATCLDTSLLFASAIEQMGLYPIVVLLKEHAFVGVWLKPTSLGSLIVDDAESLRKRIQLKELLVFETTTVTHSPAIAFSAATRLAEEKLAYGQDDEFELMLDVHLARSHQIRPLSFGGKDSSIQANLLEGTSISAQNLELGLEFAPEDLPDFSEESNLDDAGELTSATRLNIWQKKLLNLSPSNPLLHCKITQSNLALLCPDPAKMEDALASDIKLSLVAAERVLKTKIDSELRALRTGETLWVQQAQEALQSKQLLVNVPEAKLSNQLVALFRKTKTVLEEGGANTLYLAVGFLNWRKKDKTDKVYHAPLILLPVKLERASVSSGVKLVAHEDEPRFNTTLLQMLKQDFDISIPSLEGELPTDDSGLDVPEIWNRVRRAIKEVDGFEVVEEVVLGHFSFNKYLMWKDLIDRTDSLMEHPLVAYLIDRDAPPPEDGGFVEPSQLDELYKPEDFFAPLPLDSSQLAVLAAADKGKSFVIEGPPGTGKSQTITNLIAHLMAKGKTVLFVSEKMAALEVVYRRLEQVGLGRFCLQLHSNKANKKDVLNQLRLSWDGASSNNLTDWQATARDLLRLRNDLNQVVKTLHQPGTNGLTPHYAMGVSIQHGKLCQLVQLEWPSPEFHDVETYQSIKELVHQLQIQAGQCFSLFESEVFRNILNSKWDPSWQKAIVVEAQALSKAVKQVLEMGHLFLKTANIPMVLNETIQELSHLHELALLLSDASLQNANYAFCDNGMDKIEALEEAIQHLTAYIKAKESLSCDCPADIWKYIDGESLALEWDIAERKWLLPRFIEKFGIKQTFKNAGIKGNINMPKDAKLIQKLRQHGSILEGLNNLLNDVHVWEIEHSNIEELEKSSILARRLRQLASKFADTPESLSKIRKGLDSLLKDGRELLAPDGRFGQILNDFIEAYQIFDNSYKRMLNLSFSSEIIEELPEEFLKPKQTCKELLSQALEISSKEGDLKEWCNWQRYKQEAIQYGLSPLISVIEQRYIEVSEIEQAFEAGYCQWWSQAIMTNNTILREFSSAQHMDKIARFSKLDDELQELTLAYISASLSGGIPKREEASLPSDWKLIQREMQKQRQIKAVRQLICEANGAVKKLAPCMMMSPLSIAQYLPVAQDTFDVVIFDEASQITVWDAIGALSRGSQVIVAGDPKQMPPSNFFGRSVEYNEDESGVEEDLESILDELIGSGVPTLRLNWHYRSRCESLIAFSNDRYYDGSLVTFPAVSTDQKAVSLVSVNDGVYARGARTNEKEAKALVQECVRRLKHSDPLIRNKSIGIVTFNSDQQKLIEDLLDEERNKYPELEPSFNTDNPDAVFVKNLETVQGDERDVILFSVTYGPDITGKVSMNFGPLNRSGGERRLNVAFTRAKYEMVIFSSLQADQIDLNRTKAQGVADLKYFLQYAKQGKSALGTFVTRSLGGFESPFEQEVANAMRQKGWMVHTQIGASSYRIDLAIVHPDKPGAYLAGIECDGATYHRSATARDRDKLRQAVLENLGWKILRVWSTDWWINKKGSIEELHLALSNILESSKSLDRV
ncbi:MAG: DUF4011 domain-containing protein [Candidatus Gastranaerophilales bacterium]|nr:DUF4011 domain-containing protein [Candidatus Gastranaerophilales bacterium]